jgi:hypothetical protein
VQVVAAGFDTDGTTSKGKGLGGFIGASDENLVLNTEGLELGEALPWLTGAPVVSPDGEKEGILLGCLDEQASGSNSSRLAHHPGVALGSSLRSKVGTSEGKEEVMLGGALGNSVGMSSRFVGEAVVLGRALPPRFDEDKVGNSVGAFSP